MTFKKGVSGNPKGRPPATHGLIEFKKLTMNEVVSKLTDLLHTPIHELSRIYKDPNTIAIDALVASIVHHAIKDGCERRLNALLDRIVGKVPNLVQAEVTVKQTESIESYLDSLDKPKVVEVIEEAKIIEDKE